MRTSRFNGIVVLLFTLSGATGLMYETTWSKYLSLFIGNTRFSHMIVPATFCPNVPAMAEPIRLFAKSIELPEKNDERYYLTRSMALNRPGDFPMPS